MHASSELPEFLAAVARADDSAAALRAGVALIAETFDAEIAAIVHEDDVLASVGFGSGDDATEQLLAVAHDRAGSVTVQGIGSIPASVVHLDQPGCVVVVVRISEPLDPEEVAHALAMGRVLALALRMLDAVSAERELRQLTEHQNAENRELLDRQATQQRGLEAILRVQRLISQRRPIDWILEAITSEAAALLEGDLAGVCVFGADGVSRYALSAPTPAGEQLARELTASQLKLIGRDAAASALVEVCPLTHASAHRAGSGAAVVGAPVHDDGHAIGGLFLISADGDRWRDLDSAAMHTFASQASIALTDASTLRELHHAFHDSLTGLPNRALFLDQFEHALELSHRIGATTALLFIDLDGFKSVNDTLGHAAGDALLRDVGRSLADTGQRFTTVARLGGDEFAVVLERTSTDDAVRAATHLLDAIGTISCPVNDSHRCRSSIGVAVTDTDCRTTDELLRRADIAMYSVKARGGGDVALYDPSMGRTRLDQSGLTEELQIALVRDELVVHYQPIVSLQTRTVAGVEALVRWQHPERGLISPADFIGVAEDSGLIVPIGRRVLDLACQQTTAWRRQVPSAEQLGISVNLSGRQLQCDSILDDVDSALRTAELDPAALTLEVTESIFVGDADATARRLRALKELGVKLAVDDFGTGFSSLSYIHEYPFDVLKIDRSFVRGLGNGSEGAAVVKTMLALAEQLSMATVAEGVENSVELAQLRALRCSHVQGFLLARPLDTEAATAHLGGHARSRVGVG